MGWFCFVSMKQRISLVREEKENKASNTGHNEVISFDLL